MTGLPYPDLFPLRLQTDITNIDRLARCVRSESAFPYSSRRLRTARKLRPIKIVIRTTPPIRPPGNLDVLLVDRQSKVVMLMPTMANRTLFLSLLAVALSLSLGSALADDADSNTTLKSDDGKVQLVMPPGWVAQKSSNSSAALEGRNDDSNAFVMVIVADRSDPYETLDDYAKARRDEVLSHLVNAKFTGPDQLQINGFKAMQYEVHGTSPASKVDFGYFLTIVRMRRHYLEIVSWSVERHFAENADVLKSAAKGVSYSGDQ